MVRVYLSLDSYCRCLIVVGHRFSVLGKSTPQAFYLIVLQSIYIYIYIYIEISREIRPTGLKLDSRMLLALNPFAKEWLSRSLDLNIPVGRWTLKTGFKEHWFPSLNDHSSCNGFVYKYLVYSGWKGGTESTFPSASRKKHIDSKKNNFISSRSRSFHSKEGLIIRSESF